ncbi:MULTISPECIES: type VI secretion system-associated protein VasI [unclassified Halomonas]|uniref:type VI secretion system-associated protein VasI n=1 Tax=unclassified Halomonas TaxID=2609666 RepID=UPI00207690BB|nr:MULTISPECIES: type VI secretion system-associated protein VasI [unclassified Halomonas]
MNVKLLKDHWPHAALLLLGLVTSAGASEQAPQALLESARACSEAPSRLERLNCYDALFMETNEQNDEGELPALWYEIERQEATRDEGDMGLIATQTQDNILISVPALGTTPPRPVMVLACEKWITRFQLHLPEPLGQARVDVRLVGDNGSVAQQWRVRDGGRVVGGGRGLPAIETLRQLLGESSVTLQSDVAELDGLRFDVAGLRQAVGPLRDACGW